MMISMKMKNQPIGPDTESADKEMLTTMDGVDELIMKVRTVVRIFKSSACKMDDIFAKFRPDGDDRVLILDCKTRWNSIYETLKRFVDLKDTVRKSHTTFERKLY